MQWPKREAAFWEEMPFFRLLLPFIAGIALYDAFPQRLSPAASLAFAALVLATLFGLSAIRRFTRAYLLLRAGCLLLFGVLAGYGIASTSDVRNQPHWIGNNPPKREALLLRITAPPRVTPKTWRMEAEALAAFDTTGSTPVAGKLMLMVYKKDHVCPYRPGDTLVVANKLQLHSGPSHPFGFDARRFYGRQNNHHQLFLSPEEVLLQGRPAAAQAGLVARLHHQAMKTLTQNVADADTRALLQAMLLGSEEDFDPELRKTYADTGVIHVVAISGAHLATLFLAFFFIPYLIRGRWGRRIQYGLGLLAVWIYVLVAGAPPSAIRAAVVFTLLAGSVLLDIRHHALNTLLAGVFFILVFQPMWLYAVGFQLSVLAVLSIVLFYPHVRRWLVVRNPVLRLVWNALALSLCAQILVAPLSVYYFHNFPVAFLPANLVAWLLIGVIALFGGIGVLSFAFWPALSKGIAGLTAFFVHGFNRFIRVLQGWNPDSFSHIQLSLGEMLLVYLFIITLSIWLVHQNKKAFFAAGGALALLLGVSVANQYAALAQSRLVVYGSSRQWIADQINGRFYQSLFTPLAADNFKPAQATRTGYHAWRRRQSASDTGAVWIIAGKTVLLYRDSANRFSAPIDFPIDVLLVARPLKGLSAAALKNAFHPKILVAGSLDSRWRAQTWKDSCARLGQPFHATALDGAYVLE